MTSGYRPPAAPDRWTDWRERAACLGEDPELFFPVGVGPRAEQQAEAARRICAPCPVARQCGDWAVRHGYEGIWGGLDDTQRRVVRRNGSPTSPAVPTEDRPRPVVANDAVAASTTADDPGVPRR